MNLNELINRLQDRTGYNDPAFRTTWRNYVNDALRDYARKHPWPGLEGETHVIAAAGASQVILPHFVDSIIEFYDTANNTLVQRHSGILKDWPVIAGKLTTGRAFYYEELSPVPSIRPPKSFLNFESSGQSDTSPLYATGIFRNTSYSGTPAERYERTDTANANGLSAVTLSVHFEELTALGRASALSSTYIVRDSSGVLAVIPPFHHASRYRRVRIHYALSKQTAFRLKYRRLPVPLIDSDQQLPPGVDPDYILEHAIGLWKQQQGQYQQGAIHTQRAISIAQDRAQIDQAGGEFFSRITPEIPQLHDDDYLWRGD